MKTMDQHGKITADPEAPDALFTDALRTMAQGKTLGKISTRLRDVVEAVKSTGKPGVLTLKVAVLPMNAEATLVKLSVDASVKIPTPPMPAGTFFTDEAGGLSRTDPNQSEITFKPQVSDGGAATITTPAAPKAAAQN
jgi:hypothetical protein